MASPEQFNLQGSPEGRIGIFNSRLVDQPFVRQILEASGVPIPTESLKDEHIEIKKPLGEENDVYVNPTDSWTPRADEGGIK